MKKLISILVCFVALICLGPTYQNYYVTNSNPVLSPSALSTAHSWGGLQTFSGGVSIPGTVTVGTLTATNGSLTNVNIWVNDQNYIGGDAVSIIVDDDAGAISFNGTPPVGSGAFLTNINPDNISIGNNLSFWNGPSNTITLGNSPFTKHYVYTVTNGANGIAAIDAAIGHTNAGEWTASLSITNQWGTNHFIVLPGGWNIYGEAATNWLTLTNGTAMRIAILASTNQWNNKTNAWVSWRKK